MTDLASLCSAWGLQPLLSMWRPNTGTIHQTHLLKTEKQCYALRAYCYGPEDRWRIESEHKIIAHVQGKGLPAIAPLPLPSGETLLEHEGSFYALFPFAVGQQVKRNELTDDQVAALGAFLALVHATLQDYPQDLVPHFPQEFDASFSFTVDHIATLKRIEEIEAIIRSQPCKDDVDRQALTRLVQRKTWLTTTSPVEAANLLNLEQQVIHGDYQESNVFFYGGQISAIIDWDSTYPAPRAWEVVRALHYLFGFDGVASHRFCNAYCQVLPLSLADLEVAAAVYGWIREHDLWVFEELYVKGNRRVRPFIRPGNFVPLAHRWVPLQRVLCQSKTDK